MRRLTVEVPSDQILSLGTQLDVIREVESLAPVNNLPVSIMGILSTERGPADLAFKHNSTQAPPVTVLSVAVATEDLRRDVVGRANRGVGHKPTRLTPVVNDTSVANCEIDLIKVDRITIARPI